MMGGRTSALVTLDAGVTFLFHAGRHGCGALEAGGSNKA
jgi:hypothetical protein